MQWMVAVVHRAPCFDVALSMLLLMSIKVCLVYSFTLSKTYVRALSRSSIATKQGSEKIKTTTNNKRQQNKRMDGVWFWEQPFLMVGSLVFTCAYSPDGKLLGVWVGIDLL